MAMVNCVAVNVKGKEKLKKSVPNVKVADVNFSNYERQTIKEQHTTMGDTR